MARARLSLSSGSKGRAWKMGWQEIRPKLYVELSIQKFREKLERLIRLKCNIYEARGQLQLEVL